MLKFTTKFFNKKLCNSKRSLAFTLAEVLVTLGIIGVVAEMTIPIIVQNAQESAYTSSLKSFYGDLSGAISGLNGSPDDDFPSDATGWPSGSIVIRDAMCTFLGCVTKDTALNIFGISIYGTNASCPATAGQYKAYKSSCSAYTDIMDNFGAAILKNGMYMAVSNYWIMNSSHSDCIGFRVVVDTNGKKGPNMYGQDLNQFDIIRMPEGYYKALAEGAKESTIGRDGVLGADGASPCVKGTSTVAQWRYWSCTYWRIYKPDEMP